MTRKQVVPFNGAGPAWPASYVGFYSDSGATTPVTVYSDQIASTVLASGKTGSSPVRKLRADNLGAVPPPALGISLYVDSSVTTLYARPETITGVAVSGAAAVSVASFGPDGPIAPPDPSQQTGWTAGQIDLEALKVASAVLVPTVVKSANYTAAVGDLVPFDLSGGSKTLTLPTAPADKARIAAKVIATAGTNTLTIACGGSDVLNKAGGPTSGTLSLLNQAIGLQYAAATGIWYVVSDDLALSQLDARYSATYAPLLSTLPKQYSGVQVTDECIAWGDTSTTATAGTSRVGYITGMAAGSFRLVFINWNNSASTFLDVDGSSTIVFAASIEVAGTIYRVTFGGRTQATLDGGGIIVSDPVALDLAANTQIWVRTFLVSGTAPVMRITKSSAAYGGFTSVTDLTAPGSGAIAASTSSVYAPAMILGIPTSARPLSFVAIGDSRASGFRDDGANNFRCINPAAPQYGAGGYFQRALTGVGGLITVARASDTAALFASAAGHNRRGAMIPAARRAIINYGVNDFFGSAAVSVVANNNLTIATRAKQSNILTCHLCTLEPVSASTDMWGTTGNQTKNATVDPLRVVYNNWVRAGAPIDPTALTYVAVGTSGALTMGNGKHPFDGYLEIADQVESARDSGLWKAAERVVADAAMTSASATLTSATANFSAGDVGKDVNVAGAGAAAGNLYAIITAFTNSTTVTLGTTAGTTVTNATLAVNPYTPEGIHGNERANAAVATVIGPILTALT